MPDTEPSADHWTAKLPKKRVAAGALFFNKDDQVLLVEPTYVAGWDYPGGVVEADETPYAAACREIEEELGLSRTLGPLLAIDCEPAREEIPLEGLTLTFDGGVLSDDDISSIRLPPDELHRFEFCTPAEARERLPAHLWRRIALAIQARASGSAVYLENGYQLG